MLVGQIARIEVTVTASEIEALLLEFNLIKRHRPRYNVLLKDDKSFPYIHLTAHEFPRLAYFRGTRKEAGRFFGPYPNSVATRETLLLLQKLFRIRPCEDTFFANRSRPCLQYQIQRCSAPCVGFVSKQAYAQDVSDATRVLEGRNDEVVADLRRRMDAASETLHFEDAARLRDQIAMLKEIQSSQSMTRIAGQDIDAVALSGPGRTTVFRSSSCAAAGTSAAPITSCGPAWEARAICSVRSSSSTTSRAKRRRDPREPGRRGRRPARGGVARAAGSNAVANPVDVRGTRARWLEMARPNAELGSR